MATVKKIVNILDDSVDNFDKAVPAIQREMFREVELIVKTLDTDSKGNIKKTAANLRKIRNIKRRINRAILDPAYLLAVKDYTKQFTSVTKELDTYFKSTFKDFVKPGNITEIKNLAVFGVKDALTEAGITGAITNPVTRILGENVQAGASFANTAQRMRDFLTDNKTGKGALTRYTNVIVTDAINTYARTYNDIVSKDLGLEWFQYVGALVRDSRGWCVQMVEKRYIHKSELKGPPVITNAFPQTLVPLNTKTGLPQGMKAGTNSKNVLVLAGGWNCNHQFIATPKEAVPKEIREKFE